MSQYVDLIVKCTATVAAQLIDEMQSFIMQPELSKKWLVGEISEKEKRRTMSEIIANFFYKDISGEVVALLALVYMPAGEAYNEGRLWVANVVPRLKNHLEPIEYNRIVQQFAEEILKPVLAQKFMQLTCEMSQVDEKIMFVSEIEEDDENVFDGRYADFRISCSGKIITHTCQPDKLANIFGTNSGVPLFLTSVFFKTAVLDKYRDEPSRYDVESCCLRCKRNGGVLWSIPIDNQGEDCVSVFLGDLGHLPYAQQLHFASQNILKGEVSETFFRSQIDAEFCDSTHPVAVFKSRYYKLRTVGWEELGWHLLLPLAEQDQHYMSSLKLLTHNEQKEFDEQVLSLTKILIDSLNEKALRRVLLCEERGISLLDSVLKYRNVSDAEQHIKFLRNLQELRSTSVAHRKGDKYIKAVKRMGIDCFSLDEVIKILFLDAIRFLEFLSQNIRMFVDRENKSK